MNNTITVSKEEAGLRVDRLLSARFEGKSRSYFQYLLNNEAVLLNGVPVKKRIEPKAGDLLQIIFLETPRLSAEPEAIALDIIYEDEHILAINKPSGMVVHPAPGSPRSTFVNALLFYCDSLEEGGDPLRPGIVHRLDKETSGLLLAAKTREAHLKLSSQFAERLLEKKYLAIAYGRVAPQMIESPIGRHPVRRKEMAAVASGRAAKSAIEVLGYQDGLSLLSVRIFTGRTHQIRVHLKHIGAPVLGDAVYGNTKINAKYKAARQMLHAHTLRFNHPITQKPLELTAPPPDDFQKFMDRFLQD